MSQPGNRVTVYRSMDSDAKEDCESIIELLTDRGIAAVMLDDSAPDVPEGTYEVQVADADVSLAQKLIAENPLPDEVETVDDSENLDLVTISHLPEFEATEIKSLLEDAGIATVLVGDSVLPNFPFEVKVARANVERARELIDEVERANEPDEPAE